jgi:hypothetical protein
MAVASHRDEIRANDLRPRMWRPEVCAKEVLAVGAIHSLAHGSVIAISHERHAVIVEERFRVLGRELARIHGIGLSRGARLLSNISFRVRTLR